MMTMRLAVSVENLKWPASLSPSSIALSGRAQAHKPRMRIATAGPGIARDDHETPPRLPRSQNVMLRSCASLAIEVSNPVPAPANAFIATPASKSAAIITVSALSGPAKATIAVRTAKAERRADQRSAATAIWVTG